MPIRSHDTKMSDCGNRTIGIQSKDNPNPAQYFSLRHIRLVLKGSQAPFLVFSRWTWRGMKLRQPG